MILVKETVVVWLLMSAYLVKMSLDVVKNGWRTPGANIPLITNYAKWNSIVARTVGSFLAIA